VRFIPRFGIIVLELLIVGVTSSAAQDRNPPEVRALDEGEHHIVFELGAAGDWSRREGLHQAGHLRLR